MTTGDSPPPPSFFSPPADERGLSDGGGTPLCEQGHQGTRASLHLLLKLPPGLLGSKKFLAGSLVHLIDGETEAPRMRRPVQGPSSEPATSQTQTPPLPVFPGLFRRRRPGNGPGARTQAAGGAEGARLLPPCGHCGRCSGDAAEPPGPGQGGRGACTPRCQASGGRGDHALREDRP